MKNILGLLLLPIALVLVAIGFIILQIKTIFTMLRN